MSPPPTCPFCGSSSLRRHCPPMNPTCTWDCCVHPACKAAVDRVTGKHTHPGNGTSCKTCGPITRSRPHGART